jgi:excisionase family DNA binding protein
MAAAHRQGAPGRRSDPLRRQEPIGQMDLLAAIEERLREVIREEIRSALKERKPEPLLLNTEQAAEKLQLPVSWVASAARDGRLPCVKLGHHVRFKVSDLEAFIDEQRSGVELPALRRRTKKFHDSQEPGGRLDSSNSVRPVRSTASPQQTK